MAHKEGYYGAYGDSPAPGESAFKPSGEPDNRDKRGSIEGSGVPATPPVVAFEPDTDAGPHPFAPGEVTVVRRATNEATQPIDKPISQPDIVGGSDAALPVEPGV